MRASTHLHALSALIVMLAWLCGVALAPSGAALSQPDAPGQSNVSIAHTSSDPAFASSDVAIDLVRLTPHSVAPGSRLIAEVDVTNQSSEPLDNAALELSLRPSRVTEREDIASWTQASGSHDLGDLGKRVAMSSPQTLAPGKTARMRVSVKADDLNLPADSFLWGPRRVALTVRTGTADEKPTMSAPGVARSTLRTFVVWKPETSTPRIDLSYLAPVAASDPALMVTDPDAFASELKSGRLATALSIADVEGVTPWVDPALGMPLALPEHGSALDDESAAGARSPAPAVGASASDEGGAEFTDPTDAADPPASPRWIPSPASANIRERLEPLADQPSVSMPFAQADPRALSRLPGPTRTALREEASAQVPGPMLTRVPPQEVTPAAVRSAGVGADAVLIPAESMWSEVDPTVTPSGYGQLTSESSTIPLLGYDSRLTHLATRITADADPQAQIMAALADTAVVAGQDTDAHRSLLIAPEPGASLDAEATSELASALEEASWVTPIPATELMSQAKVGSGTTDVLGSSDSLWTGPVSELKAVATGADGAPAWVDPSEARAADAGQVTQAGIHIEKVRDLRSILKDPQFQNASLVLAASTIADPVTRSGGTDARLSESAALIERDEARLNLSLADNYNLVASGSGVPLTVTNRFDTPVTITPTAEVSERIVRVKGDLPPLTIEPRSSANVSVPIEALTSGEVALTVGLATDSGVVLTSQMSGLEVNPDWENWVTISLGVGMALLLVVGVIRAGRTGSDARAPAERGPEDLSAVDAPRKSSTPSTKGPSDS